MDLNFSFALVSSLTPRTQSARTPLIENNKLSSKSQKVRHKQHKLSQEENKNDKENLLPAEQLMNKNEHLHSHGIEKKISGKDIDSDKQVSPSFPIDLANIAVRRTTSKGRRRSKKNPTATNGRLSGTSETNSVINSSVPDLRKKGVKRKSPQLNGLSQLLVSDIVILENSPEGDAKNVENNGCLGKDLGLDKQIGKLKSPRVSGASGTSLSTAYDSDSFHKPRRRSVKVIPETPETDESLNNRLSEKEISLESLTDGELKKKLRSSNESSTVSVGVSFELESSIKKLPVPVVKKNIVSNVDKTSGNSDLDVAKKDKRKLSMSPVLKEINSKEVEETRKKSLGKKTKGKETINENTKNKLLEIISKNNVDIKDNINKLKENSNILKPSLKKNMTPKPTLVPPLEIIPKFEHISNWLKDTQEKSVILISSDSSLDSPANLKPSRRKPKMPVTLSPRIKKKMKIAQNTLQEEQRVFEDLYGGEVAKRLSDDIEDVVSVVSSREPVELSEKVLEKLYGTVWQKNAVLPQSEPRKGRKKKTAKKKSPQTDRKKKRTSIYDVFSSSSSEDRFEEFLENVRRGKAESTRIHNSRPGTPDFINDSESECDSSLVFYQNVASSAVKEEVNKIRVGEGEPSIKLNRRRLSFTSSKDDCSESGKSDIKAKKTEKKKTTKADDKPKTKTRSKKNQENPLNEKGNDVDAFTLVTPIKVKEKNNDVRLSDRIKNLIDYELPKNIGKSKTPRNSKKCITNPSTEDKLRAKYLGEGDFKVPKCFTPCKTPSKTVQRDIPSSPALSFLSSLSDVTAGLPCHPDALVFKKDFKNKREELTKKLFSLYNREVFENQMPADLLIQWNTRMTSTSGFCYNKRLYSNNQIFRSSRIVLSTKILDRPHRLRDTLIHELCHAATWIINGISDGHGPNWRKWADKSNRRFPELPVIKRCHDYSISTKFTYKCMSCGYSIGRHSKSLDTENKRCGYCYGKFQCFVTAKMTESSATSGSDSVKTQRTPSGFALFVKENYASVKKENNVKHGEIMKLLSQKFAEVKISKQNSNEPQTVIPDC